MTQAAFVDGGPLAGTGFPFFQYADEAIVDYLKNTGSLHSGNRLDLTNFLASEVANFRAHFPRAATPSGLADDESQTIQGVKATVYVMTGRFRINDWTSVLLNVSNTTTISIWTSDADPQEAGRRCIEVSGAIAALIEHTFYTQEAGFDWPDYYAANTGQDGPANILDVTSDEVLLIDGKARQVLTFSWGYEEEF